MFSKARVGDAIEARRAGNSTSVHSESWRTLKGKIAWEFLIYACLSGPSAWVWNSRVVGLDMSCHDLPLKLMCHAFELYFLKKVPKCCVLKKKYRGRKKNMISPDQ